MYLISPASTFVELLNMNKPYAEAAIAGNRANPKLNGIVKFFKTPFKGILIESEIFGLPDDTENESKNFYGMHIHEFGNCTPPFDKTGEHYNPEGSPHPYHAGDLLPLIGSRGYTYSAFFDNSFDIDDIIGKSVIIHARPDDFTTQPSGNSGEKIGCGIIKKL